MTILRGIMKSQWAVAILAVGGILGLSNQADAATVSIPTNGTAACKATSAAGASSFYYNHTYLWNGGTTNQYLTCVLPEYNTMGGGDTTLLNMHWAAAPGKSGTVTCTAQVGAFYFGANHIIQGSTVSTTLAAGGNAYLAFPVLTMDSNWNSINMICNVPPGFKLGLIERHREN